MAWTAPGSDINTGDLVTAANWNQLVKGNTLDLRAGGVAMDSQAAGDVVYASSATQFARVAIGTANKVLTSNGSIPAWVTQIANSAMPDDVDLAGSLDVTGATTLDGTLSVVGAVTINDAGTDIDTRIESDDNQNMLFVDGGEDRVGIGTGAPQALLDVTIAGQAKTDTGGVYSYFGKSNEASNYAALQLFAMGGSAAADRKWKFQTIEAGVANAGSIILQESGGTVGIGTATAGSTLTVNGSVSKSSGSFRIDHPLPAKRDTNWLVHSFIEGPRADLIYRGTVTLVAGSASVDLDAAAGMSAGTWVLLCRDAQVFTSNESGWWHVRGTVTGSTLTIDCEESDCTDTVSWMVVASRKDTHMYDTEWTNDDGYPIVEPLKPEPEEDESE